MLSCVRRSASLPALVFTALVLTSAPVFAQKDCGEDASGFQGWLGAYGRKLAAGERSMSGRSLRMINEIPGIAAALSVVLVIVRPF